MEENISNIVSQEAFAQLEQLARMLRENTEYMAGLVKATADFRSAVDRAGNVSELSAAVGGLSSSTEKLNQAQSRRLDIERQIKAEGQRMLDALEKEDAAMDASRAAMNRVRMSAEDTAAKFLKLDMALKQNQTVLKDLQKEAAKSGAVDEDRAQRMRDLTILIQKQKVGLSELQVQMKENAKLEFFGNNGYGNYDEMNALLGQMRDTYRSLSEEERNNSEIGGALMTTIGILDEKLKAIDKTIGNNQRNVGNYDILLDRITGGELSLRSAMTALRKDISSVQMQRDQLTESIKKQEAETERLKNEQGEESKAYKDSISKAESLKAAYDRLAQSESDLTGRLADLNRMQNEQTAEMKVMSDPNSGIGALSQSVGALAGSYQGAIAAIAMFGGESSGLKDTLAKVMLAQQALNAVVTLGNALKKTSAARIKAELVWQKLKLAFTKKQVEAEKEAAVSTATLAAGEKAATAATVTLSGAIKSVGAAIKSIPVVGWLIAAAAALATLTALVVRHRREERELTKELAERKSLSYAERDARQSAMESTQREVVWMKNAVGQLSRLKEGSEAYKTTVNDVAEKLGVSAGWLEKNVEKVNSLADAWINVKRAQAKSTAYMEAAADRQVKFEETMIKFQRAEYKERRKILEESGLFTKKQIDDLNYYAHHFGFNSEVMRAEIEKARKDNDAISDGLVSKSNQVMREQEGNIAELTRAQEEGNRQRNASNNAFAEAEKRRIDNIRKTEEKKAKSFKEIYETRMKYLELDRQAELRLYGLTKEQTDAINAKYDAEKKDLELSEQKRQLERIEASNREAASILSDLNERRLRDSGVSGERLMEALLQQERARNKAILEENEESFKKEAEGLEEGSAEYLAVKKKWDAKNEKQAYDSAQNERRIRKEGIDGMISDIESEVEKQRNKNILKGLSGFDLEQANIQAEIDAIDKQIAAYRSLGDTVQDVTDKIKALLAKRKQLSDEYTENEEKNVETQIEGQLRLSEAIGGAVISIGNALADGMKESVRQTQIQQAIAMAQVLLSQGVAVAKAVEAGAKEGATKGEVLTMYASIITAVGAVLSQIVTATNAVKQARTSIAQASAYAEGTEHHAGGDAVVGEGGSPELVVAGRKAFVVDKPTFIKDLPVGSKVIPLSGSMHDTRDVDLSGIERGIERIAGKKTVEINVSDRIVALINNGYGRTRILNSQFRH